MSLTDIVYWVIEHFEGSQARNTHEYEREQEREHEEGKRKILLGNIVEYTDICEEQRQSSPFCCLQHYLNESVLYNDLDLTLAAAVMRHSRHKHYEWLESTHLSLHRNSSHCTLIQANQ